MNRRAYLAAIGVASLSGLAGCNQISGKGDKSSTPKPTIVEGPAQFTDFKIESPKTSIVDTTVRITVSAFNYGSEAGGTTATLATVEGAEMVSKQVSLIEIDSGTRGEATIDLTFSAADEFVLGVFNSPSTTMEMETTPTEKPMTTAKLTVDPKKEPVGKTFDIGERLNVTLTDVMYRHGVKYTYEKSSLVESETLQNIVTPGSESVFAVLQFRIENIGVEPATFDMESFSMVDGSILPDLHGVPLSAATNVKGTPVADTSVKAGQTIQGWLLANVSRQQAKNGAAVQWQRDQHKTTPERMWTVEPKKLPSFELVSWEGTNQEPGTHTHTITVTNSGALKGTFHGGLETKSDSEWNLHHSFSATLEPNQTKTFTGKTHEPYVGSVDYRLRPFGEIRAITINAPTVSYGETVSVPHGKLQVDNVEMHSSYTASIWDHEKSYTSKKDTFILARVTYVPKEIPTSVVPDYAPEPDFEHFVLKSNNMTYSPSRPGRGTITTPVSGPLYEAPEITGRLYGLPDPEQLSVGESWTGWIVFDVPSSVALSNATIVFSKESSRGTYKAEWTES